MSMSSAPTHDGFAANTPSSSDTTVVASPSSWQDRPAATASTSRQPYLDIPSFRPSLDSTHSELSELSFQSNELRHENPLIRSFSRDAVPSIHLHRSPPPSTFRAAWDSFLDVNYGALLVLASQGFGTGMNISARLLETPGPHGEPMHPFQILFARQSITALICTAYGMYAKTIPHFPLGVRGVRWLLVLRGVSGFFGVCGMYFSLLYLPLSEATVLGFLSPILTCYLCSFIMPGETFTGQQQLAGFVSLIGVMFIARPSSLISLSSASSQPSDAALAPPPPPNSTVPANSLQEVTQQQHLAAVGIAMIGVIGATGALSAIRIIGTRAHAFISINYFSVWCSVVSLAGLIVFPDVKFRLPGNLTEWGLLAVLGFCGFIMQFLLTAGLAYGGPTAAQDASPTTPHQQGAKTRDLENAGGHAQLERVAQRQAKPKASGTRATAMCYTQMLFALAGDKLVFGATPDTMSWIGSVLILAGAVWVAAARDLIAKDKKRHPSSSSNSRHHGFDIRSPFGLLRRQTTGKERAVTREEGVALMTTDDDDVDGNLTTGEQRQQDDLSDLTRRDPTANQIIESLEMDDLAPSPGNARA